MPSLRRIVGHHAWFVLVLLQLGCNSLNPLCGSARPAPTLNSISPATVVFSQLPSSFIMTANGSDFVASSVMVFNGTDLPTTVVNNSQLTGTVTSSMIPAPGIFTVKVQTPAGTTGDLGCSSGGTSSGDALTVN